MSEGPWAAGFGGNTGGGRKAGGKLEKQGLRPAGGGHTVGVSTRSSSLLAMPGCGRACMWLNLLSWQDVEQGVAGTPDWETLAKAGEIVPGCQKADPAREWE